LTRYRSSQRPPYPSSPLFATAISSLRNYFTAARFAAVASLLSARWRGPIEGRAGGRANLEARPPTMPGVPSRQVDSALSSLFPNETSAEGGHEFLQGGDLSSDFYSFFGISDQANAGVTADGGNFWNDVRIVLDDFIH